MSTEIEPFLPALPQWFGIEEATTSYILQAGENPTFLAIDIDADNRLVGFLTLYAHSPFASEISVMAVLPEYHRQGVGRALLAAAEVQLRNEGVVLLQVKTLNDKHPNEGYMKTRAFYLSMGFLAT